MKNVIVKLHKVTGMVLSLLFSCWFVSGIVLVFAGFPHYNQSEAFKNLQPITVAASAIASPQELPKGAVSLEMFDGRAVYRVGKGSRMSKGFDAQTLEPLSKPTEKSCVAIAKNLVGAQVVKVKKINTLDIWLPWEQYTSSLPIYKVYLNDNARSVVYVSSKNGAVVQLSNLSERVWACVGAIPHYIIFKYLSLKSTIWTSVLVGLLVAGAFACLSGLVVGITRIRRKKGAKPFALSPYRRGWFRWHHLAGLYIGIFTLTFSVSAYVSVAGVPQWIAHDRVATDYSKEWNSPTVKRKAYAKSFPALVDYVKKRGDVKRVTFSSSLGRPCYRVFAKSALESEVLLCSGDSLITETRYSTDSVVAYARQVVGSTPIEKMEVQTAFDNYYQLTRMGSRPLPVIKLVVADADRSWLYVSPKTGEVVTVSTTASRTERWLYRALHTFNIQWLKEHEWLRKLLLLVVCMGGAVVSITGLVLTVKWLARKVSYLR